MNAIRNDARDQLITFKDYAFYLEAILACPDVTPADILCAFGDVARSKGLSRLAQETGLTREALYKALSGRDNPRLTTLLAVTKAFGLRLAVLPVETEEAKAA